MWSRAALARRALLAAPACGLRSSRDGGRDAAAQLGRGDDADDVVDDLAARADEPRLGDPGRAVATEGLVGGVAEVEVVDAEVIHEGAGVLVGVLHVDADEEHATRALAAPLAHENGR